MNRAALFVAAVLLLINVGSAGAEPEAISQAQEQLDELLFEEALATLDASLRSGNNSPKDLSNLYVFIGQVHASMDDEDAAEDAFKRALVIAPAATLPENLSPKIGERFAKAQSWARRQKPARIAHRVLERKEPVIAIIVQDNPLDLMAGARLTYWTKGGDSDAVSASGHDRIDLDVPADTERFVAAGIDQFGNRVVELGSKMAPLTLDPDQVPVLMTSGDERKGPPLYAHYLVWGGVSVAFAGLGTWAGLSARSQVDKLDDIRANSADYEFSDVKAVADKAEQRALIANISFAAAGASAVLATYLFIRRDRGKETDARAAVVPTITPEAAGVSAQLRF